MKNSKSLLGLFTIIFITTIFARENRILWDFGVIINTSINQQEPTGSLKSLSNLGIDAPSQINALISDPFIPPTQVYLEEVGSDIKIPSENLDEILPLNIHQVNLLISQLTMQNNYQTIINIANQIDFSLLDKNDRLDLSYWLANAFLHTGNYSEAEKNILSNMALEKEDRSHFLLAMIYENQGQIKEAKEEYLNFIKQFPESDYKVPALIKVRILGLPK